ncbi:RadC family protein [Enterobacillus tribolii]|uniref:UPF0758 protein C8D90_103279 n=1 Tax=Enterobacillus tribolii TaxID=1487935 RepID=A0A370QUG6_9GAMM|nr:DNA repair protein RadC [Enterobacillus tribolii]MBW7981056.1 JAB domain-containing protein [Enterobacillus tribolii]RDK92886.1 DNA replication and repair protein RadC [Enterobacillus tribolii]
MAQKGDIWQFSEAPREKLLRQGAAALSDQELLALFLRTGTKTMNVMALSGHLLREFGSVHTLMTADYETFCAGPGLGISKYTQFQAVMELAKRFLSRQVACENAVTSPQVTTLYLQNIFSGREREIFVVLFLDSQYRVIRAEEMFSGTINYVNVYPREIVREAMKANAAALILAHNHPSGMAEPSMADRQLTEKVVQACALLEIRVLDHIVVGQGQSVSFAERGWI